MFVRRISAATVEAIVDRICVYGGAGTQLDRRTAYGWRLDAVDGNLGRSPAAAPGAAGAAAAPSTHAPAAAPTAGEGGQPWFFAPSGNGYFVAGPEGSGFFSGYQGFAHIELLLRAAGHPVPMCHLLAADKDVAPHHEQHTPQPTVDQGSLRQIYVTLAELRRELQQAQADQHHQEADRLQHEIDRLVAAVNSALGLGGIPRDLNNPLNRWRSRLQASLRRVYKALRTTTSPLEQLATHLEVSIASEGACLVYRPDRPLPWIFSLPVPK